ncbi:(Fe-S)-binding protein [Desulfofustis glycolicus]|uniref:Fe-S oxidoreductase n=1 Tax=Desulfofustis glycolicus DSM 9705 TaxID=1121409 RepID=A0A1M5TN71_9BACT|nr:(Fe-S)-binding protein [Desulfofustis glycolicus]MCB2216502.1 (Fe-S)-binding protein [Desulfobulbaceae bacterium]SHH52138.1 Fe-S oxidoreductase [Desulfofustis glycolicus DSM 9705]
MAAETPTPIPIINFKQQALQLLPDGASFDACLTCGLCSSGCPAAGIENMDPRKFIRMAMLGMNETLSTTPWIWCCTMCRRCQHVCPMSIDISQLVLLARSNWPNDRKPAGIVRSCTLIRSTDSTSAMGLPPEDFVFVVNDVLDEVRATQPAFAHLQAPIDKQGAHFFVNQNSREPMSEPDEMVPLWKILDLVGADWTYSSKGWAAENFCMFAGDEAAWYDVTRKRIEAVDDLGCSVWLNTECGHSYYALWNGINRFDLDVGFRLESLITYYARWIREGKLPVNSDWNRRAIKFTVQDPCMIVRKAYGESIAEDMRFVVRSLVGADNFIDMQPNRSANYCCGGGGGFLQAGMNEQRRSYGKRKFDQIQATGAAYVLTPCHNCHSQMEDLADAWHGDYHVVHFWTLICLSLGILGENERTYLGPDLLALLD